MNNFPHFQYKKKTQTVTPPATIEKLIQHTHIIIPEPKT